MEELETSKENYRPLAKGRVLNPGCEAEKCADASPPAHGGHFAEISRPGRPVINEQTTREADDPLETWERCAVLTQKGCKRVSRLNVANSGAGTSSGRS